MSSLSQQISDFQENLNPLAFRNPPCYGKCGEKHVFEWGRISESNLEPLTFLYICCEILCCAAAYSGDKQGAASIPLTTTKVTCNGQVHNIEWTRFKMPVFNDPAPKNALQATLASVCERMHSNTTNRSGRLGYGKHSLRSREVFSRIDILNTFKSLRGKGLDQINDGIKSIKVQDFVLERGEWNMARKKPYAELWSAKDLEDGDGL